MSRTLPELGWHWPMMYGVPCIGLHLGHLVGCVRSFKPRAWVVGSPDPRVGRHVLAFDVAAPCRPFKSHLLTDAEGSRKLGRRCCILLRARVGPMTLRVRLRMPV